jgi:hypothetical protein
MTLTNAEEQRINNLIEKTKQIEAKDPEYKVFGSKKWEYKWPEPASEELLCEFEKKHDIILPREYRMFLKFVSNGGPGPAYGIYPIGKAEI